MDQKTLYDKAEKAINQAFEATKKSVKIVSEKAGQTAKTTKLLIEKISLEHQVTKQFAKIGNKLYEKSIKGARPVSSADEEIKTLIEEAKKLDTKLSEVEATLGQEKK